MFNSIVPRPTGNLEKCESLKKNTWIAESISSVEDIRVYKFVVQFEVISDDRLEKVTGFVHIMDEKLDK